MTSDGGPDGEAAVADDGAEDSEAPPARGRRRSWLTEFVVLVVVALAVALTVKTYVVQPFKIPSQSMENTLLVNDRVLVNKLVGHVSEIHRGDIVVFNGAGSWKPPVETDSDPLARIYRDFLSLFGDASGQTDYIKRVIGVPGDTVACCDAEGRVTVNGVPLNERSYLYPGDAPSEDRFNIVVPPGRLWVMGDNRSISDDSRDHEGDPGGGTIPENAVIGRAFVIIWPPSRWRILPIPATFEQPKLNSSSATAAAGTTAGNADAAALLSARLEPSSPALPLSLGFAAALPVSWVQRRVRRRAARYRAARRPGRP